MQLLWPGGDLKRPEETDDEPNLFKKDEWIDTKIRSVT